MRYTYESGFESFKKAQRTYIRSGWKPRLRFHLYTWGLTVIGLVCLLSATPLAFARGSHPIAFVVYIVGCGCTGGGVVGLALLPWQRRRVYRMFNGDDRVLHLYMEVETLFLVLGRPGRAETRLERAAVSRVAEDGEFLLLFLDKKRFIFLPKTIGAPALDELRGWLALPGGPSTC